MKSAYNVLFELGRLMGCHQMPERSFFIGDKQFPVCARCTGVLLGYLIGGILFIFYRIPIWLDIVFCGIMFLDWLIQRLGWKESNNIRRLLTGTICGVGWMQLYLWLLLALRILIQKNR